MSHKKKGRRIYTRRARNHRIFSVYHPFRSALGTVVMLVLIAALGFVGYHIVGPVVSRMRAEEQNPTTTPEPFFAETTVLAAEASATTETTTATVTTTTSVTVTTTVTEQTTATTAEQPSRFGEGVTVAYLAEASTLTDLDSVEAEAMTLYAQGYRAMVLPMKETGGMLHYASGVQNAVGCGASNADMLTLREIRNAANRYHIQCIAMMSTLEDKTYPNTFMDGSYTFKDGTTRWLDAKPEKGGKPWLSPFADGARNYLSALAGELSGGGFVPVICTDTRFPDFFDSDAELLGSRITDPERRKEALVSVLNAIADKAPEACCMIDLHSYAAGSEEAFVPDKLKMKSVCVQIDIRDFTEPFSVNGERYDPTSLAFADKVSMLVRASDKAAAGKKMIPCIVRNDLSDAELDAVIAALKSSGHSMILVTDKQDPPPQSDDSADAADAADAQETPKTQNSHE
ncbi:MAG: hypothetical protein IKQ39_07230 [Oscillospiraceae bacterium]|nr:hypothetical protein [Oscillospiraceae bacterium]